MKYIYTVFFFLLRIKRVGLEFSLFLLPVRRRKNWKFSSFCSILIMCLQKRKKSA